jgi:hypothetical protein
MSRRLLPMARDPRNIGASVRARLLERARAERSDFQILLTRYALERLLYRLSVSTERERFVLKGALLLVTLLGDPFRPTPDLDLSGHGDPWNTGHLQSPRERSNGACGRSCEWCRQTAI